MMTDLQDLKERCRRLEARLQGQPHWPELRGVYLELVTVVGQLQGAVGESSRAHGETEEARMAERSFERLKSSSRKVGLDIRLASEAALLVGLQDSLQSAFETLDWLERAR